MTNLKARKLAVVTGAEGFIGSNLVRELVEVGWDVVALHRPGAGLARLSGIDLTPASCDILAHEDIERALPEEADAIFHLAADPRITNRRHQSQTETNVRGTMNVLNWALKKRCRRFLFTSSMGAFGIHAHRITEETESNAMKLPINYFQSKYLAELEVDKCIERGLDAVIVNPANVVGPRDSSNMPATFIRLVHGSALPVISSGSASFCHVREVARTMIACVERGRTGERYLLGGADTTFFELGRLIESIVGGTAPKFTVPGPVCRFAARLISIYADLTKQRTVMTPEIALSISSNMLVDSSKAIQELGYRPASIKEMFTDAAAWLRENELLEIKSALVWSKSPPHA